MPEIKEPKTIEKQPEKVRTGQNTSANESNVSNKSKVDLNNKEQSEEEPSLKEDYEALKEMNLLRNVMVRLQYGRFPDSKIDGILKRRMNLDERAFQGPYIIRGFISVLFLFLVCSLVYVVIWLSSKWLGLSGVAETASMFISLFFFCGIGFVIFNSLSAPDEKKLKIAINERMAELEKEFRNE